MNPAAIGRQIADLQGVLLKLAKDKTEQLHPSSFPNGEARVRQLDIVLGGSANWPVLPGVAGVPRLDDGKPHSAE